MGSANPKSIEAMRWAAMEEDKITAAVITQQSFDEHNAQLYVALALLGKGGALVTVKNTEVNNGLRIARYVRQQQQRSPTSTDAVPITAETC